MSDIVIVALVTTVPSLLTSAGVFYGIVKARGVATQLEGTHREVLSAADRVAQVTLANQNAVGNKLDSIHVLVNDQLTQAISRAAVAEARAEMMHRLLLTIAPDHPDVLAIIKP